MMLKASGRPLREDCLCDFSLSLSLSLGGPLEGGGERGRESGKKTWWSRLNVAALVFSTMANEEEHFFCLQKKKKKRLMDSPGLLEARHKLLEVLEALEVGQACRFRRGGAWGKGGERCFFFCRVIATRESEEKTATAIDTSLCLFPVRRRGQNSAFNSERSRVSRHLSSNESERQKQVCQSLQRRTAVVTQKKEREREKKNNRPSILDSPSLAARETHASVLSPDLLYTEMGKPFSATLRARFWPMTARPTRPTVDMLLEEGEALEFFFFFFRSKEQTIEKKKMSEGGREGGRRAKTERKSRRKACPPTLQRK